MKQFDFKIHNFYLVGKENFDAGLNSSTVNIHDELSSKIAKFSPPNFKLRETIHEAGYRVKNEYKNYKYKQEDETIIIAESFHFKDFDVDELNIWPILELVFHQGYLYGISYITTKTEIYEKLSQYLVQIYGQHKEIPSQRTVTNARGWFSDISLNSIFLEKIQTENGDEWIKLTFNDGLIHMFLNKPVNVYQLIRQELYEKEIEQELYQKTLFQKSKDFLLSSRKQKDNSLDEYKKYVYEILSQEVSTSSLKTISDFIISNVNIAQLNLQWCDWLIEIALKCQNAKLLTESELIYNLVLDWYNGSLKIKSYHKHWLAISSHNDLINLCCDSKRFPEAIKHFNQSFSILEKYFNGDDYNYQSQIGRLHYNIARVYDSQNDYSMAIEHYQKSLKHFEYLETPWMSQNLINGILLSFTNLGICYSDIADYSEAEQIYATAIRFAYEKRKYSQYCSFVMNLAYVWVKLKKYTEAELQYKYAIDFIRGNSQVFYSSDLEGNILLNMADLYKEINRPNEEIKYLSDAIAFYTDALDKQPQMHHFVDKLKSRKNEIKNKNN